MSLKIFGKAKIIKAPAGFQLMNYRLVVITLEPTVFATLLDNKKKIRERFFLKIIIKLIVYSIGYTPQYRVFHTTLISHNVYIL